MIKNISKVYDEFLNIKTEASVKDLPPEKEIFFEYLPTSYKNIEDLFTIYPFNENDHIADFGCGKGRVLLMAAYYSCRFITGYEIDSDIYKILLTNIKNFQVKFNNTANITIFNINIEKASISDTINKFFFFNPFHLKVFMRVMVEIKASLKRNKRDINIFLHYPYAGTIKYMDSLGEFKKIGMKECSNSLLNREKQNYLELVVYSNI